MKFSFSSKLAVAVLLLAIAADANLLGGFNSISKDDPYVQQAVNKAMDCMGRNTNGLLQLNQIKSAEQQIVAGSIFKLTLEVNIVNEMKDCNVVITNLLDQSWHFQTAQSDDHCNRYLKCEERPSVVTLNRKRRASQLLGGSEVVDFNDQFVQEAANWAIDHINGMSNSMYRQSLLKIADATRQVVNGYKYRFLLYMVSTKCLNNAGNSGKSLEDCPAAEKPMHQQCDTTVLFSGGKYSMLDFNCKALKPQHILGGDGHDYIDHGKVNTLIGGDDHDYKDHGKLKMLLGGDDHDYKDHGKVNTLIGGDSHDYKDHGKLKMLLGGDYHDYKDHGKVNTLIGGDGHDYKDHGKVDNLIGGDDHDYKDHGKLKMMLGGDDHDYKPHRKSKAQLLGQDFHDYIPHLKFRGLINAARNEAQQKLSPIAKEVLRHSGAIRKILGGDTHDYQSHMTDPCEQYREDFEKFKSDHQRLYSSSEEETEKFLIFCGNMEKVKEYQKQEQGSAVYGATKFADISEKEFKEKYLGWKVNSNGFTGLPNAEIPKIKDIPESWDWRDHNAVTPVKNQGTCGSCWAFSTTGNIEGQNAVKNKKLVSLSEQELLDCDKIDEACNGGLPSQAYEALMKLGGIETEKDYGYAGEEESCQFKKSEVVVKVKGAVNISKDEKDMAVWLQQNGPISIGINAFAMQFYMGGIAHPWKIFCNPASLDHGVLIVGYGKQGNEPYWIVKNSWGESWGRDGYYYVYRGDGTCGLNTMCTSAIVE